MTLSKREKRLLYCLGCVVIVAIGMYLFIFPAMNTYAALSEQLSALGAQQMTRAEAIANMNGLDADVRDMKKDIERIRARYASSMFSETLDRQITNLLRQHNGRPVSLILGEPAEITVSPYGNSADTASDPSETDEFVSLADYMAVIDSAKNSAPAPTPEPQKEPDTKTGTLEAKLVSLQAALTRTDAIAFLAELSARSDVLIQDMSMVPEIASTTGNGTKTPSGRVLLTVNFQHLLAPKLPYDSTVPLPNVIFS